MIRVLGSDDLHREFAVFPAPYLPYLGINRSNTPCRAPNGIQHGRGCTHILFYLTLKEQGEFGLVAEGRLWYVPLKIEKLL